MLKSIIHFSMKNAVALFLMVFLIIAGGVYSLKEINIEKYPNVDIPYMTVVIVYPGSSPEQVMREIGEPIEREFLNIEGVKNVYTDAKANVVASTMEFDISVSMDDAEQIVRSGLIKYSYQKQPKSQRLFYQDLSQIQRFFRWEFMGKKIMRKFKNL